jgi:hypothetical protein
MVGTRLALIVGWLFLLLGVVVEPARAEQVTGEELRELARRAINDESALVELRRVDEVEGRSVDIASALRGAEGRELRRRLEALASDDADDEFDADSARDDARTILSQRRFSADSPPRPLRGFVERTGDWLRQRFDALIGYIPGGVAGLWVLMAAIVVAVSAMVAARAARRRTLPIERRAHGPHGSHESLSPAVLEREASAAEGDGDYGLAIRLRFRAGLLTLDRLGVIDYRPSITSTEVAATVRSATFQVLAAMFDEIVYGGRAAEPHDAAAARDSWEQLRAEVGRR